MRALSVVVLLLFLASGTVKAATEELRFAKGSCEGTTWQWWSVQRFVNGRLVETWGTDCSGREYHTPGRAVDINGPLTGHPTENGRCDAGPWFAVTTRSAGVQTECWGQDCSGRYWRFEPDTPSVPALSRSVFEQLTPLTYRPVYYEQVPMPAVDMEPATSTESVPGVDIR